MHGHVLIPVKATVAPHDDGHKRIVLTINGRVSIILDYDPANDVVSEVQHEPHRIEHRSPLDGMETKADPMGDH